MSWTDSATVKKHLFDLDRLETELTDVEVHLDNSGGGSLPHRGIVENSEKVKVLAALEPAEESNVTLNGESWVELDYENLVPGDIVVATDDGLETLYRMDEDYAVNWEGGKLRRIDTGSIGNGAVVTVYYLRNQVLVKDTDYPIDYSAGEITVATGSTLEPDTTLWVDYQISAASGADQLISEAIVEAEDRILSNLSDDYDGDSEDQGLKTGATELTLSIICRGLGSRALCDGAPSAEGRSRGWRELAILFEVSAWRTLRQFLKSPQMAQGSRKSNRSWEWE